MPARSQTLRLGTRGSELAVRQTHIVAAALGRLSPGLAVEIVIIRTTGDDATAGPAWRGEAVGLFTSELENALRENRIDAGVHSLKDLPIRSAGDVTLGAVLERDDPADALIDRRGRSLSSLPAGARIGTSSIRRRAQLLSRRRDVSVIDIRGNVPARLRQVEDGHLDAVILAVAGLKRLGRMDLVSEAFPAEAWLPAAGQGAIAVQIRTADLATSPVGALDHGPTRFATTAEREFMAALDAGCRGPVGALGRLASGGELRLTGLVASVDGRTSLVEEVSRRTRDVADAADLGRVVARRLEARGAVELLMQARGALDAIS